MGRGEIELGIHQISEILPVKGIRLVGPLPEEIQNYTAYTAARVATTTQHDAAIAFLLYLASPDGKALFAANGIR